MNSDKRRTNTIIVDSEVYVESVDGDGNENVNRVERPWDHHRTPEGDRI